MVSAQATILCNEFENDEFNIIASPSRGYELKERDRKDLDKCIIWLSILLKMWFWRYVVMSMFMYRYI